MPNKENRHAISVNFEGGIWDYTSASPASASIPSRIVNKPPIQRDHVPGLLVLHWAVLLLCFADGEQGRGEAVELSLKVRACF